MSQVSEFKPKVNHVVESWQAIGLLDDLPENVSKEHMATVLENQRLHNVAYGKENLSSLWIRNSIPIVRRVFSRLCRDGREITSSLAKKATAKMFHGASFWHHNLNERFKPSLSLHQEVDESAKLVDKLVCKIDDFIYRELKLRKQESFEFYCLSYAPEHMFENVVLYYGINRPPEPSSMIVSLSVTMDY